MFHISSKPTQGFFQLAAADLAGKSIPESCKWFRCGSGIIQMVPEVASLGVLLTFSYRMRGCLVKSLQKCCALPHLPKTITNLVSSPYLVRNVQGILSPERWKRLERNAQKRRTTPRPALSYRSYQWTVVVFDLLGQALIADKETKISDFGVWTPNVTRESISTI